jgi:hypothetical protein
MFELQAEDRGADLGTQKGEINPERQFEIYGSHSPQLFAEAFTDMFSWFPSATSLTRPEQRADFTPAGNFCKYVSAGAGRLAICQPFSDVLLYGTCREDIALPGRSGE